MFQLELAALEPIGQFFTDGLFNDARPGKADECPRFGERNITQTGKAGRDPACGGVGQHADVQPAAAVEPFQRGAGFGHLHQAENALLHPCAATGRKNDERQVLVGSVLNRTCDFSPTAVLMLPIKKRLSSTATTACTPPILPIAVTAASFRPVLTEAAANFS